MSAANPETRLFVALWPPPRVRRCMVEVAPGKGQFGRLIEARNLHLTLAFLGSVSAQRCEDCQRALEAVRAAPFRWTLDRLGVWRRTGILWLGASRDPSELLALQEQIVRQLSRWGFPRERRTFHPHVTVARKWHQGQSTKEIAPVEWAVDAISLVASSLQPTGAEYRVVRSLPLRLI